MPCEAEAIGTNAPGKFKAQARNLLKTWESTTEQNPKHNCRLLFRAMIVLFAMPNELNIYRQYVGRLIHAKPVDKLMLCIFI